MAMVRESGFASLTFAISLHQYSIPAVGFLLLIGIPSQKTLQIQASTARLNVGYQGSHLPVFSSKLLIETPSVLM